MPVPYAELREAIATAMATSTRTHPGNAYSSPRQPLPLQSRARSRNHLGDRVPQGAVA